MHRRGHVNALILAAALVAVPTTSAASFLITLDTSPLSGSEVLAFGLTNNDGVTNNVVTLTNFDFDGGSALAGTEDCTIGDPGSGCSGDLSGTVTLQDLTNLAFFLQGFTAGSQLSFTLTATNNFAGGTPDGFAMYVCDDATLADCYSDDSNTLAMLILALDGTTHAPASFTLNGAALQELDAPVVTELAVPEPTTLALFILGGAAMAARGRRCERNRVRR